MFNNIEIISCPTNKRDIITFSNVSGYCLFGGRLRMKSLICLM